MSTPNQAATIPQPDKVREMHNHHMDSTRWQHLKLRDGDIVVATWAKSGTTWTQQIICQLIFDGAENIPAADVAPWVDLRFLPLEEMIAELEGQSGRRLLKTHLPRDALIFSPKVKYVYVGRDGRDILWSMYHHHMCMTEQLLGLLNDTPGLVGPPLQPPQSDIVEYFHEWLDKDGFPFWPFWSHVQSWWDVRSLPNVMLLHFNDLKADMPSEIRRIADFLQIEIDESLWPTIIEHCTFDYMKKNAPTLSTVFDDTMFRGGLSNFINKGTNGRWRDMLSTTDIEKYERAAMDNLTPDCAHWLATGELSD